MQKITWNKEETKCNACRYQQTLKGVEYCELNGPRKSKNLKCFLFNLSGSTILKRRSPEEQKKWVEDALKDKYPPIC